MPYLTTRLRNGACVLAKEVKIEGLPQLLAKTYANRKQAETSAAKVGGIVASYGRPFYVVINENPLT